MTNHFPCKVNAIDFKMWSLAADSKELPHYNHQGGFVNGDLKFKVGMTDFMLFQCNYAYTSLEPQTLVWESIYTTSDSCHKGVLVAKWCEHWPPTSRAWGLIPEAVT